MSGESATLWGPRGVHSRPFGGDTNDWITPEWIIEALGPFDLDPCASTCQPWPCAAHSFTYHDDGLRQPWEGRVWLNPPYGPNAGEWLRRLAAHGTGTALIAARTETRWFQAEVWDKATALLFLAGRLTFHRSSGESGRGNSGHSSVLVAYGPYDADRLECSTVGGAFTRKWRIL